MKEVVKKLRIKRKKGSLYYINKEGNVVEMDNVSKEKKVVAKPKIEKERDYLYFLNKEGDVGKAKRRHS